MALPSPVVSAYLSRLRLTDLAGAPPSLDALIALHEAHVRRVPWETVWIHEGLGWGITPTTSAARIATGRRGGYCYHLNGAFSELLASLGYAVTRHVGGVHGPDGPSEDSASSHMALVVADLPADACPDGRWYVDVGSGDALGAPVPLAPGPIAQPPFELTLDWLETAGGGDWRLTHDPRGAFVAMTFSAEPATMDAFAAKHEWMSTSPDSGFATYPLVLRRTATTVEALRGLDHTVITTDGTTTTVVDDRAAWLDLLDELGIVPRDPDALWDRTLRAHEQRQL